MSLISESLISRYLFQSNLIFAPILQSKNFFLEFHLCDGRRKIHLLAHLLLYNGVT